MLFKLQSLDGFDIIKLMTDMKYGFVFPGQGVQIVGMGMDLAQNFPVAQAVFDEVDSALGYSLSDIMFYGDMSQLTQTQNAQPAIMAVSVALLRVIEAEVAPLTHLATAVAGHSLGEYSALCAAGVLNLTDTAKLLQVRGRLMADAAQSQSGGMLALLGADLLQAKEISEHTGCFVANDNCAGQVVLSGTNAALTAAKMMADNMNIKRAVPLAVAGAFHSPMMADAAEKMTSILNQIQFNTPKIPIYFNVTAASESNPAIFPNLLKQQIAGTVRWRETVQNMPVDAFVECGQGTVLSGLIRRICPEKPVINGSDTASVRNLIARLQK